MPLYQFLLYPLGFTKITEVLEQTLILLYVTFVFYTVILCLSEARLSDNIHENELGLIKYNFSRCDRNDLISNSCRGGGVLIVIRKDGTSKLIPITIHNVEHLFVNFTFNNTKFVLSSVYFPPNSSVLLYESYLLAVLFVLQSHTGCFYIPYFNFQWAI